MYYFLKIKLFILEHSFPYLHNSFCLNSTCKLCLSNQFQDLHGWNENFVDNLLNIYFATLYLQTDNFQNLIFKTVESSPFLLSFWESLYILKNIFELFPLGQKYCFHKFWCVVFFSYFLIYIYFHIHISFFLFSSQPADPSLLIPCLRLFFYQQL